MNTTSDPNNLTTNNSSSHSTINDSNPGRTTYVATNIRSYFPFPIPLTRPSIKTKTRDTGPIANGATQPVTVMLTEASDGLSPRPFAGSALSLHNLIPALRCS